MFQSTGVRFIAVGLLAFLMFVPLDLVSGIVQERSRYSDQTVADISHEWGGRQLISGPLIEVPVTEDVTYERKREVVDPVTGRTMRDDQGLVIYEHFEEVVTERRPSIFLYPEDLTVSVVTESQIRKRGIFEVPVYTADVAMTFDFAPDAAKATLGDGEVADWSAARLTLYLASNRGLRGEAVLEADGRALSLEPVSAREGVSGITAELGDPRALTGFALRMSVNGAGEFSAAATGRTTRLTIASDWPDPSFFGAFLPDNSEVSEAGFNAAWTIPHLARTLPQASRENLDGPARAGTSMGVRFLTPNDFYQKAWRSARYGLLFISLTFLTILLVDRGSKVPAHPVQFLMVGLAQALFVLLMVAYAEQIGFGAAYLLSAGAVVGLITAYAGVALKFGRRSWGLGALLVAVYGVLYPILRSADYALLAGTTLAFLALAATMFVTRNETWHGSGESVWLRRRSAPKSPEATPAS
jgi:inner membrane protein